MTQICTTIEQSRTLIQLGIDITTADMFWHRTLDGTYSLRVDDIILKLDIPAWSLSALLKLMPKLYEFENDPDDGGCQPNLCKGWDNNQWHIVYRSSIYITEWYEDPIDACYEMIIKLHELKML